MHRGTIPTTAACPQEYAERPPDARWLRYGFHGSAYAYLATSTSAVGLRTKGGALGRALLESCYGTVGDGLELGPLSSAHPYRNDDEVEECPQPCHFEWPQTLRRMAAKTL